MSALAQGAPSEDGKNRNPILVSTHKRKDFEQLR